MWRSTRWLAATAVAAAGIVSLAGAASALPGAGGLALKNAAPSSVESVRWGGRGFGPGAFVAGAILGGALLAPRFYGPRYYGPPIMDPGLIMRPVPTTSIPAMWIRAPTAPIRPAATR